MALQGRRFNINLDESISDTASAGFFDRNSTPGIGGGLLGDVRERVVHQDTEPPSLPRCKASQTGFPAHKVRTDSSRFRRRKADQRVDFPAPSRSDKLGPQSPPQQHRITSTESLLPGNGSNSHTGLELRDPSIDQENKQRLAEMSDQEIEEARQELMKGLNPSLIEKLLKKANIDEGRNESMDEPKCDGDATPQLKENPSKSVNHEQLDLPLSDPSYKQGNSRIWDSDAPPLHPPPDLYPASSYPSSLPLPPDIHFPNPPRAPDLDPSDPDFLSVLHSTYFPKLPADPSTMAWMTPLSPGSGEIGAYSPSDETQPASAIRFDFRGHLLPPRLAAQIPATKGLHHHAHAPSSAGYTVPELSHLARSSYPAQRCIAYQTLGRILYRLGRGDFGQAGEDLCDGFWQLLEQEKVVDQLVEAAAKGDTGHRSVWVTATDAVWLWRKGGGKRWRGR